MHNFNGCGLLNNYVSCSKSSGQRTHSTTCYSEQLNHINTLSNQEVIITKRVVYIIGQILPWDTIYKCSRLLLMVDRNLIPRVMQFIQAFLLCMRRPQLYMTCMIPLVIWHDMQRNETPQYSY